MAILDQKNHSPSYSCFSSSPFHHHIVRIYSWGYTVTHGERDERVESEWESEWERESNPFISQAHLRFPLKTWQTPDSSWIPFHSPRFLVLPFPKPWCNLSLTRSQVKLGGTVRKNKTLGRLFVDLQSLNTLIMPSRSQKGAFWIKVSRLGCYLGITAWLPGLSGI